MGVRVRVVVGTYIHKVGVVMVMVVEETCRCMEEVEEMEKVVVGTCRHKAEEEMVKVVVGTSRYKAEDVMAKVVVGTCRYKAEDVMVKVVVGACNHKVE